MNKIIHIAPMMGWTDRHGRHLLRLLSPHLGLWSEMKAAAAVIHGADAVLDGVSPSCDVVLQLGGCVASDLALAAKKAAARGFRSINLNMGCPSCRVGAGGFGAAMMLDLEGAARCVAALKRAVDIPISVKCRIGVDDQEPEEVLPRLLETLAAEGVRDFVIHARKAWLKGLSPKQNRTLPPLDYALVYKMKQTYPHLNIILNGGITDLTQARALEEKVDGVMIGRAALRNPFMLTELNDKPADRQTLLEQFTDYALCEGLSAHHLTHYVSGLWTAQKGAAYFRRKLNAIKTLTEHSATDLLHFTQTIAA